MSEPFAGRVVPSWPEFRRLVKPGRAIPVRLEVSRDTDTPVSAFLKVSRGEKQAFLLESVEGERVGRYSMLGARPLDVHRFALGLGEDPLRIGTLDADGVALAGVKALEARSRQQADEVAALRLEVARLRELVTTLTAVPR